METAFAIRGLCKSYKGFALEDVNFELPRGYVMGLIGPNGAGKTTIIKAMMNLVRKDAGAIDIFGLDNVAEEAAIKARIGFVYDAPCFHGDCSLGNIKRSIAPFYARWDDALFNRLAGEFDLPLKKRFKTLSQGMKMKFALSLALSHDADLIIMDEPTAGLDPVFRRELLGLLAGLLQDERKSILFSTHITSDLERIADFITFVRNGRVVFSQEKDSILENWGVVKGDHEQMRGEAAKYFKGFREGRFGCEAITDNIQEVRRLLGSGIVSDAVTLDDIMFFLGRKGAPRA
ncbi:MAG: ABC transporter ATP-binding protein [bacterium]|nr:ABC transporter ATP-binding protein [bacterium]